MNKRFFLKNKIMVFAFLSFYSTTLYCSFFLFLDKNEKIPLFCSNEQREKIPNIDLSKTIDIKKCETNRKLPIDKNNYVNFHWYQNNKSDLVILGLGIGGELSKKIPYITELIKHYDVIVFDYEWQNPQPFYKKIMRVFSPFKRHFENNYLEVSTIVDYIRKQKKYASIIGCGECYSSFMFVKAEANKKTDTVLFDKLILDSPILSTQHAIKSFAQNPGLCVNSLDGDAPNCVKMITGNRFFLKFIDFFTSSFLVDYTIKNDLNKITIPVLFIRGTYDNMVSEQDFEEIWNKTNTHQKAALLTPFHHSNSFKLRNARKEWLYGVNLFIQNSFNDFIEKITM